MALSLLVESGHKQRKLIHTFIFNLFTEPKAA
jgi:hypothetical protein